jgi:ribose transport system ATP-binding protein
MNEIISYMIGRDLSELYPKENIPIGEVIFEAKNISAYMVKNNSFSLHKGEILGMYGLVGSGRTEMMRAIFGADKMVSGELTLNNKALKIKSPRDAIKNGIALVPENRRVHGMIAGANVKENMSLANIKQLSNLTFVNSKKETESIKKLVKVLNVQPPYLDTEVKYLSGGNQQKVVIGKWLCKKSDLLIFDEPTKGIDVGAKAEIYKLMERLVKDGVGVIFISSEMPELMGICDRILVFNEGRINASISRDEFTESKILSVAISGGE